MQVFLGWLRTGSLAADQSVRPNDFLNLMDALLPPPPDPGLRR